MSTSTQPPAPEGSLLTTEDLRLFREGSHGRLQDKLGAHAVPGGTRFAAWAPNASRVSVIGDFNGWDKDADVLSEKGGIWEGTVAEASRGSRYKLHVESGGYQADKTDPFAIYCETPPATASIVWDLEYDWGDGEWISRRQEANSLAAPISIYEMHIGSWRRVPEEGARLLTYRELAPELAKYLKLAGFTHVEFLPVMEHPLDASWGYQVTGYFAPTSRYGTPQDFMYLIDHLHQNGIGVLLDWVPSHFPTDEHGLGSFDGTHLYEYEDPRQGFHPDWISYVFNFGRNEVRSFLLSSALHWLTNFHADGLRVDSVASMLYLDYSRKPGEWVPNRHGGRENLEATAFLRSLNEEIHSRIEGVQMAAEESTEWPMTSRPTGAGGLGFDLKWDLGWMHDTLAYLKLEPAHRKYHHNELTFRMHYAFTENFVLPLPHDEVVHGRGSLLNHMPGDEWQRFANLRLLLGYMHGQPGKKLLFMGGEFGQSAEWRHGTSLDWHLLQFPLHAGVAQWVADLNRLYVSEPCLHELDGDPDGFEWVGADDKESSVLSFMRKGTSDLSRFLIVCNFTPLLRTSYRVGVPYGGTWVERANSDATIYGGSGMGNLGAVEAAPIASHGRPWSLALTLPPLACLFLNARLAR